jgi:hypothetical protein
MKFKVTTIVQRDPATWALEDIGTDRVYEEVIDAEFSTLEEALHHIAMSPRHWEFYINFDGQWDLRATTRMS